MLSLSYSYQSTRLYIYICTVLLWIYKCTVLLWMSLWHYPDTLVSPMNHCWNTMVLEGWRQCGWFVEHESRFVSTTVVQCRVSQNFGIIYLLLAKIYNFWQVCSFVGLSVFLSVCLSVSLSVLSSITHERFDISSPNLVHIWNGWAVPVGDIDK